MTELAELPFEMQPIHEGERVAFREDHETHPGLYALVKSIGVADGKVQMDVIPFDPFDGVIPEDAPTHRIGMEDIQ